MIAPGSWLGLLGGGQLGRMFSMAAQSMGYRVAVVDPGDHSPAGTVADRHLRADYLDPVALGDLAAICSAATTEFENVPAAALDYLARSCIVAPDAGSVSTAQNRLREKRFLAGNGFAVTAFAEIDSVEACERVDASMLPGILKSAQFGYDGKGQARVRSRDELAAAFASLGSQPCVLERLVTIEREVSVIVARGGDGATATWPVAENIHRNGILDVSIVPARVPDEVAAVARTTAIGVAQRLDYRGVLCVEMFVTHDGRLLVNELAPRPHNSGHYTIDACVTSQFEQQVRVLCGAPLGSTAQHQPAVMINLLGDCWFDAAGSDDASVAREPDWSVVLRHPEAKLHLYGKDEARRGRKMGHVTCLADSVAEAMATAAAIRDALRIPGPGFA